jgi:beta-glucosidase
VVVVRPYETEQRDRAQLRLPNDQDQLIEAVSRVNDRTIVVLESGGPVTMPWLGQVDSVLQGYYGGQEQGRALADVLFGDVNPSGKLPISYPRFESPPERLGIRNPVFTSESLEVPFSEGVFVGYRGYEREGTRLQFPFGHGLSYTRFRYRGPSTRVRGRKAGDVRGRFTIRNVGRRTGREVAQVYVGPLPTSVPTPPKQLAGFVKVNSIRAIASGSPSGSTGTPCRTGTRPPTAGSRRAGGSRSTSAAPSRTSGWPVRCGSAERGRLSAAETAAAAPPS